MGYMKEYAEDRGTGLPDYRLEPPDVVECIECGRLFTTNGDERICPDCYDDEPDEDRMQARKDDFDREAA